MYEKNYCKIPVRRIPDAVADMTGSPAYLTIAGTVRFYQTDDGVLVSAYITGLPVGRQPCSADIFGFHVHESGPCSGNAQEPFKDAGEHYNPRNCPHPAHAGDLPPLFGNAGTAFMTVLTNRFSVGDIIGRSVIIHANPDDFKTQPSGDSGPMIACGRIVQVRR